MNVNFGFRLWLHEVTTPYDLTESIWICGDSFTFWGRCGDWILTAQWPWAVLAVSTKQYVHTYHQMRHKSRSPRWTLNQVLVSGWEQRAAANQQGQKERPSSPHNCICQENYQVGKCKQKLQKVFIRLPLGGGFGAAKSRHSTYVFGSRDVNFFWILNIAMDSISYSAQQMWSHVQTVNDSVQGSWLKEMSNINHSVNMFSFNIFPVTWPPWK